MRKIALTRCSPRCRASHPRFFVAAKEGRDGGDHHWLLNPYGELHAPVGMNCVCAVVHLGVACGRLASSWGSGATVGAEETDWELVAVLPGILRHGSQQNSSGVLLPPAAARDLTWRRDAVAVGDGGGAEQPGSEAVLFGRPWNLTTPRRRQLTGHLAPARHGTRPVLLHGGGRKEARLLPGAVQGEVRGAGRGGRRRLWRRDRRLWRKDRRLWRRERRRGGVEGGGGAGGG